MGAIIGKKCEVGEIREKLGGIIRRKYPGKRSPDAIDLSGITKREFVGPKFES